MNVGAVFYFMRPSPPSFPIWLETVLLSAILCLAAYLRFFRLSHTPGWFADEGTHLEIARHLLNGRLQYLAVNQSWLLFGRLPLFEALLTVAVSLFGLQITTLRGLTAVLGCLSLLLLYFLARNLSQNRKQVLLSALLYAIYPQAILYHRFGFSYNLLTPFFLIALLSLRQYQQTGQRRWLAGTAVALGLGTLSDLWMINALPLLLLGSGKEKWRDWLWSVPLMLSSFAIYTAVALLTHPAAFTFDLAFTLHRVSGLGLGEQLHRIATNYTTLLAQDSWIALGFVGLFFIQPLSARRFILLALLCPFLFLGRTVPLYNLSFYYLIPLLPFFPLGLAALVTRGWETVWQSAGGWGYPRVASVVTAVALAVPFLVTLQFTWANLQTYLPTAIDPFLLNPEDAQATADYLNGRLQPNDVTITSPALAWMLNGRVADFQLALAVEGRATPHVPAGLPADRLVFNPSYDQATYIVLDNLWDNWGTFNVPDLSSKMADTTTHWPLLFTSGSIRVYGNPNTVSLLTSTRKQNFIPQ